MTLLFVLFSSGKSSLMLQKSFMSKCHVSKRKGKKTRLKVEFPEGKRKEE
jgi:hypothetical protein